MQSQALYIIMFGGPWEDRTPTLGFEDRDDIHFTKDRITWSGIGESNSYDNLGKVTGNHYINPAKLGAPEETRTPKIWLLRPTRIPIPSPGLKLTYLLEQRVRFELTVLRICNPLHWASLPPLHKLGVPPGIWTPTNSFGDCHAAITLEIHDWRKRWDSNSRTISDRQFSRLLQ